MNPESESPVPTGDQGGGDVDGGAWKLLTTTVGLVVVGEQRTNVMAAEWTYFLNKDPLYVGVGISRRSFTGELIERSGEFSVTLCAEEQAGLAEFAGSFSGRDVDKIATEALVLRDPEVTGTRWADGGVAAFECVVRDTVDLPDYRLFVGEAVAHHLGPGASPLVKHGPMHRIGELVDKDTVASAQLVGDRRVRVAATGQASRPAAAWRITLHGPDGVTTPLGEHFPNGYGDLLVDIDLPADVADRPLWTCRISADRDSAKTGWARISGTVRSGDTVSS